MMRRAFVVMFAMFSLAAPAFAATIEGIEFPDTLTANGQDLIFNGGGYRSSFGWQVYVASLYLEQKSGDATGIVAADKPMDIKLQITSVMVSPNEMKKAILEAFEKSTNGNMAPLKAKIDAFVEIFKELRNHDTYDFAYIPGKGVEVSRNGAVSSLIEGLDFKEALYGIWLGDKPVQQELKTGMLGK